MYIISIIIILWPVNKVLNLCMPPVLVAMVAMQYGFVRRKSTGSVDLDKVYGPGGRYLVGPDYEFKVFRADMHYAAIDGVAIFTSDRLEVSGNTCTFALIVAVLIWL